MPYNTLTSKTSPQMLSSQAIMSSPVRKKLRQRDTDVQKATYVSEALQSGNNARYCTSKNLAYDTFKRWLREYNQSDDKENYSPNSKRRLSHRVFTDTTEKTVAAQWHEGYELKRNHLMVIRWLVCR